MTEGLRFARELNNMLSHVSLSAEVIVSELNRRGFPLSLRTFNKWRTGIFLPRFDDAFVLIGLLGDICGVSCDQLANALLYDLSSPLYSDDAVDTASSVLTQPTVLDSRYTKIYRTLLGEKVDWSADLIRKAIRDTVYVNKDFTQFIHRVTVLAVVPDTPNPSLTISSIYEDGEKPVGDECFYGITGARLGKQNSYEEDGAIVHGVQLYLPDDVVPGALHEISYMWAWEADEPIYKIGERFFKWQLDFYSCTLVFEGGIPRDIEYVAYNPADKSDTSVLSVPIVRDENSVHVMMRDFGQTNAYFLCNGVGE